MNLCIFFTKNPLQPCDRNPAGSFCHGIDVLGPKDTAHLHELDIEHIDETITGQPEGVRQSEEALEISCFKSWVILAIRKGDWPLSISLITVLMD